MDAMSDHSVYCAHGPHDFRAVAAGPLADLRLVYKDLYHVAGYPTGAGNPAWLASHEPAAQTAPVLQQLLEAGIQVVGRVQTDELAYSLNGCNAHYGTPVNPAAPDRLPGGSSSGSAVAVARGEADVGLGTDTGGSIRVPACYNGLFGLRPSHGRLSLQHMVPLAPRFDTPGWLCRDALSLERVGAVLFGEAPAPPARVHLVVMETLFARLPAALQAAWADLRSRLVAQVDALSQWQPDPARIDGLNATFRVLQGRQAAGQHQAWLASHMTSLAPDIADRFRWACGLNAEQEAAAEAQRQSWIDDLTPHLANAQVLCLPTTPDLAPRRDASDAELAQFRERLLGMTAMAGLAGLPQVHLPLMSVAGVPFGISLIGAAGQDMTLLALARRFSEGR